MQNGLNWEELTAEERLLAEQAVLNLRTLNRACDEAADGTVLAVAETLAMQQGRELIRRTLEVSLNRQAQEAEKKGGPSGLAPVAAPALMGDASPPPDDARRRRAAVSDLLPLPGVHGGTLRLG
jgi:hypothetical protein